MARGFLSVVENWHVYRSRFRKRKVVVDLALGSESGFRVKSIIILFFLCLVEWQIGLRRRLGNGEGFLDLVED